MSDPMTGAPQIAYHWSPTARRSSIAERGLRIRSESTGAPIRFPYVAFSLDPLDAWSMSAGSFPDAADTWDLWAVLIDRLPGFEVIPYDDGKPRELRCYRSIPTRHVAYVATRATSEDQPA